jgi:hypothetical protein
VWISAVVRLPVRIGSARYERRLERVGLPAMLLTHRGDLVEDWVRAVNRIRTLLIGISPARNGLWSGPTPARWV